LKPLSLTDLVLLAAGCSGETEAERSISRPAFVPEEMEVKYQEREALRYAIDQLEQEERARADVQAAPAEVIDLGAGKP